MLKVKIGESRHTFSATMKVMRCSMQNTEYELLMSILFNFITVHHRQVLGRTSPFPLILLPQFGGYWIEGTNHEFKDPPEADQPLCPTSHIKLETNSTAKIYRKQFMGKVRMGKRGLVLCYTKQQKKQHLKIYHWVWKWPFFPFPYMDVPDSYGLCQ